MYRSVISPYFHVCITSRIIRTTEVIFLAAPDGQSGVFHPGERRYIGAEPYCHHKNVECL